MVTSVEESAEELILDFEDASLSRERRYTDAKNKERHDAKKKLLDRMKEQEAEVAKLTSELAGAQATIAIMRNDHDVLCEKLRAAVATDAQADAYVAKLRDYRDCWAKGDITEAEWMRLEVELRRTLTADVRPFILVGCFEGKPILVTPRE